MYIQTTFLYIMKVRALQQILSQNLKIIFYPANNNINIVSTCTMYMYIARLYVYKK